MNNLHSRVISRYREDWQKILVASGILLLSISLNLLKPWPLKLVIDHGIGGVSFGDEWSWFAEIKSDLGLQGFLIVSVVFLLLIHLLWGVLNYASQFQLIQVGLRAVVRLRNELFEHLGQLSMKFHDRKSTSDIVYRLIYDAQSLQTFFNQGFATVVSSGLTLVGILCFMFAIDPLLTLISIVVVPLLLLTIRRYAKLIRNATKDWNQKESELLGKAGEYLSGMKLIQALNQQSQIGAAFSKSCQNSYRSDFQLRRVQVRSTLVVGVVTALGTSLLLYFGANQVIKEIISLGDLILFISYLAMLYQPLEQLSYTAWAMEGAVAQAERVFEVIDEPLVASSHEEQGLPENGTLRFEQVTFGYDSQSEVLAGIDLEVTEGKMTALVGGSGSGKSTLLALVPRFYAPQSGRITLGGMDISKINLKELRSDMTVIAQESFLFDASIRDNLYLAKPQASESDLWSALEAVRLDREVKAFSDGLDTQLGERGQWVSGGQRQRLGLARAFLRPSRVLLFDEPTSSVDTKMESEMMDTIKELAQAKTTLIASHRLRTVHDCDQIVVLEAGRIVERGLGEELLGLGGRYTTLWSHRGR
ncbi:MAG: ABC transporter ATP-binding protein [Verrucomicrobiota bacterium]